MIDDAKLIVRPVSNRLLDNRLINDWLIELKVKEKKKRILYVVNTQQYTTSDKNRIEFN